MEVRKIDHSRKYSYSEFMEWEDNEFWELINGAPIYMGAPTRNHQDISRRFLRQLYEFFEEDDACQVYHAPFAVRFTEDLVKIDTSTNDDASVPSEQDSPNPTVVHPDIFVVCGEKHAGDHYVETPPKFIIEILSRSTSGYDLFDKRALYERHGVQIYCIADPAAKCVMISQLKDDGLYNKPELYHYDQQLPISVFDGLALDLSKVFSR